MERVETGVYKITHGKENMEEITFFLPLASSLEAYNEVDDQEVRQKEVLLHSTRN